MTPEQFQRIKVLYAELEPLAAQQRRDALGAYDDGLVRAEPGQMLDERSEGGESRRRLTEVTKQIDRLVAIGVVELMRRGTVAAPVAAAEVRRLKELEKGNGRLKRLLAERDVEPDVVRELLQKK